MPQIDDPSLSEPNNGARRLPNTKGSPTAAPVKHRQYFRFFDLPREIRDHIYRQTLVTNGYIQHPTKYRYQVIPVLGVNLLRTCRQIQVEASRVLYGLNTFQIRPQDTAKGSPGIDWLHHFGKHNCANIKYIELVTYNLARFTYTQLEDMCKALPNLVKIVIVVLWKIIDDSASDWLRLDCLLRNKPQSASIAWDDRDRKSVKKALTQAFPDGYRHVDSFFTEIEAEEWTWGVGKVHDDSESDSWKTDSDDESEDDDDALSESTDSAADEIDRWVNGGFEDPF